ncbi:hypothetical protein ACIPF8_08570 [Collimonas sp. NPDC087041]|uniref:hypothetical protein n=1 Tax=Collimonas sp. NPDC087041 TaxID=3363960 RepID=UPI0037F9F494
MKHFLSDDSTSESTPIIVATQQQFNIKTTIYDSNGLGINPKRLQQNEDHPPVIVHYHIFKNAGTSLDLALQQYFGDQWTSYEGSHSHDLKTSADLYEFLKKNQAIRSLSSHLARPPLPHANALPIVFLRNPLLRARSVYEFTRKDPSQPFRDATSGTFSDYLEWALSGAPGGVVIRDYQVIHLSSASFADGGILAAQATEESLREARALLESWPVLGVVEKYAQSLKVIERAYRTSFPQLALQPEHVNRSETSSQEETIRQEIGESLYQEFNRQNQFDNQLYRYATTRLSDLCKTYNVETACETV